MAKDAKDIQKMVKDIMKAIMADESFINLIVKTVTDQVNTKLEDILRKHQTKTEESEKRITTLEEENKILNQQVNKHSQDLRRNCVRIFGIEENDDENVDEIIHNLFNKTMKVKLNVNTSIESCFRVGSRHTSAQSENDNNVARSSTKTMIKPRAILVRFINYKERQKVMEARKLLKSSGVVIREDLIKSNLELLRKAVKKYTSKNVWTMDGKIYAAINNRKKVINSEMDLTI